MNRRTRLVLTSLLLLAVLVGVPVLLTWRAVRQERLNRALIVAVKQQDSHVVSLLAQGADANSRDLPPDRRFGWRLLLDRLQHRQENRPLARTALSVLLHNTRYLGDVHLSYQGGGQIVILKLKRFPRNGRIELRGNHTFLTEPAPENVSIAEALIQHGADVNAPDERGRTPIRLAVEAGKAEILKLLLARAADPNLADKTNTAPLTAALNNASIAELLIEHGADVNKPDGDGTTALMWTGNNATLVESLLVHGANANIQDKHGRTTLFYPRQPSIMKALLPHANLNIRDKQGRTALGYYLHSPNINRTTKATKSVIKLFKQAGAKE